jgi:uracil DNA glycosylase
MAGPFSLASLISEKTWSKALADEMKRPYFTGLEAQLAKDYGSTKIQIFPSQDLIFNALNLTPLDQVQNIKSMFAILMLYAH